LTVGAAYVRLGETGIDVANRDRHAREHAALRIGHCSGNYAAFALCGGRGGQAQREQSHEELTGPLS
jgi:hypothetical protein